MNMLTRAEMVTFSGEGHVKVVFRMSPFGAQLQEWLVRDLDGGVNFYTDAELRREFDIAPRQ
jgi:hypothetical protein